VQHENVLIIQRIAPETRQRMGSYSTGKLGIHFHGPGLEKQEKEGWIFASNGKAFIGVRFLDGAHQWGDDKKVAWPASFDHATDSTRVLLHAGDLASHASFEGFRAEVLAARLEIDINQVDYVFGPASSRLEVTRFDVAAPDQFTLPRINGKPVDPRPTTTYQSPYLNGEFGSGRISVTVGPEKRLLDFSK